MQPRHRKLWVLLLIAALAGCLSGPTTQPPAQPPLQDTARSAVVGQVDLGALDRKTQASVGTIATSATVSLIDPATNQTVATTVTGSDGRFTLNYAFTPNASPYFLEAAKGLGSSSVGKQAARIRTLIQKQGNGWISITNGSVGSITLNASTTALSAIVSLKRGLAAGLQVSAAGLLGKLAVGTPDVFTPVANCTLAEYQSALVVVNAALAQDLDPFAAIGYDSANAKFLLTGGALGITASTELAGLVEGSLVTLTGTGFDPVPAFNTVRFDGVAGVVTSASPTQLVVSMRGRRAGTLTVQVGSIVYQGPSYTVAPFAVNDGTTSVSVDNAYQYSPVTAGTGTLYANWTSNPAATSYLLKIGTTPGGADVLSELSAGNVTSYTASGRSLQGAWTGATYYVTVTPVFASGAGTAVVSNGVQVAEKAFWDGASTTGLRNDAQGGYASDFPAGSNRTQFYGHHYFETVAIANGTTTYVQPFGKRDNIGEGASMNDVRVQNPKDGWLAVHANTLTVDGTLDAAGRGYGGGPGTSYYGASNNGRGGNGGLSGNGGYVNGGQGLGAAGGGGCLSPAGRGGFFGGAGAGSSDSGTASAGVDATTAGGSTEGNGNWNECGFPAFGAGGAVPYGGGLGFASDNMGGTGGAGYGAGGGGAGGSVAYGGGGAGGTGGGVVGSVTTGLGWAPGVQALTNNGLGGPAGRYKAAADTTTDASWVLGSGGAGGNHRYGPLVLSPAVYQTTAGGGGGAGGGAIILDATTLTLGATSRLIAVGAAGGGGGSNDSPGAGGGGGGSGGTIVLTSQTLTLLGTMDARGGLNGGNGSSTPVGCGSFAAGSGGDGGVSTLNGGTIKIFYSALTGTPQAAHAGRVHSARR